MHILLSNDDGVFSPGIKALASVFSDIANLDVVAPDRDRSGASNSLTLDRPLRPRILENGFVSIQGTPTDCVHLALTGYLKNKPDFVVSGINYGANLGDDVIYSGTVAAAMEARILGIPSIAVSMIDPGDRPHYETAAAVAKQLVQKLWTHPMPAATILNVNVPDMPLADIKGIQVARLGSRHSNTPMVKLLDPRRNEVYWVPPPGLGDDAGAGTDFYAVEHGYISITPLQVDLTNYAAFEQVSKWTMELVGE